MFGDSLLFDVTLFVCCYCGSLDATLHLRNLCRTYATVQSLEDIRESARLCNVSAAVRLLATVYEGGHYQGTEMSGHETDALTV